MPRAVCAVLIARRRIGAGEIAATTAPLQWVERLVFVGLIGLMDPPRAEARAAIAACAEAGITVKMITGDHRDTGLAIATPGWPSRASSGWRVMHSPARTSTG